MIRYILIALFIPATTFAVETEVRDLVDFSEIEVQGSIDVEVRFAETYEVVVTTPDGGLQYIETEKRGRDTLVISLADNSVRGDYSVDVSTPTLQEFELQGSGSAGISDFTVDQLQITLEGSGDIRTGNLVVEEAEISVLGSGDMVVGSLEANELELELMGSGDISIAQLAVETVEAEILGSGDIEVSGSIVDLELQILGSGDFGGEGLEVQRLSGNILGSGDANISEVTENNLGNAVVNLGGLFGLIESEIEAEFEFDSDSEEVRDRIMFRGNTDSDSFGEALVALFAVVFIFGGPVLIVAVIAGFSYRKKKIQHETLRQFALSDQPVPQEVLDSLGSKSEAKAPKSDLRSGAILIATGAGIAVAGLLIGAEALAAIACIPAFIGLAKVFIWKLEADKPE